MINRIISSNNDVDGVEDQHRAEDRDGRADDLVRISPRISLTASFQNLMFVFAA